MPFGRGSTTRSLGDLVIGATYEDAKVEQAFPIYTPPKFKQRVGWNPWKKMMVFGDDLSFPFGTQYIFRGELSNFRWVCSTAPFCWGDGCFQTSILEASKWWFHPHVFFVMWKTFIVKPCWGVGEIGRGTVTWEPAWGFARPFVVTPATCRGYDVLYIGQNSDIYSPKDALAFVNIHGIHDISKWD